MANPQIPSQTFQIRHSLDRDSWQNGIYNEEFLERLKLVIGHPEYFSDSKYGVVCPTDPSSHIPGTSEPCVVSVSSSPQSLTVDIAPGMVVMQSGVWVVLTDFVRQITLANTTIGVPNVVYLEYVLQPADEQLNDFLEPVVPIYARTGTSPILEQVTGAESSESNFVRVDTVETYLGYVQSIRQNFVPLAIVTVQTTLDGGGNPVISLAIDLTRDSYSWNRPWFSALDVEHRSMQGTGVYSTSNPHAVGDNEVSMGPFTRSQVELNHGMVLAKDQSFAKVPGYRCEASIPTDQLLTDTATGANTGYPYAQYTSLSAFPVRLGRCWIAENGADLGAVIVPGTTLIAFPSEVLPSGITVNIYYTRVEALEPPIGYNNVNFETNNPTENELVIAGGNSRTALTNTQELFSDATPFPMEYELFVDGEGALRRTPQVVYCYKRLDAIGTQDSPTISQYGPGKIIMGLTGASGSSSMVVKIRVYGKDPDGVDIDELFTFTKSSWQDFTPNPTTMPTGCFAVGSLIFAPNIETIRIEELTDAGPNGAIMLWVVNTPYDTYDLMKDVCHVSHVFWNGFKLATIQDKRIIETTNKDFLSADLGMASLEFLLKNLAGTYSTLFIEDFRRPTLASLVPPSEMYGINPVLAALPGPNFNKMQCALNGPYQTRALPVSSGSSTYWQVVLTPGFAFSGTNPFVPTAPLFRYQLASFGWTVWQTMSQTAGMTNVYDVTASEIPIAVQVQLAAWPYTSMAVVG